MGRIITSSPVELVTSMSRDGLHNLVFNKTAHRYTLDGERVPGATTIGAVYPKGEGLIRWMIEQGIKEYEDKTALERGGGVGTFLHNFAELYELGRTGEFDWNKVDNSPYKTDIHTVISRFRAWRTKVTDEVVMMEALCGHPVLAAAGCIDTLRAREVRGQKVLVLGDYKTSKNFYITQLIQVIGGYRPMMQYWYDIDIPLVEIQLFPKQPDLPTQTLLCHENGWEKTTYLPDGESHVFESLPGLFSRLEHQFVRNYGTYHFQKEIENKLSPPYVRKG